VSRRKLLRLRPLKHPNRPEMPHLGCHQINPRWLLLHPLLLLLLLLVHLLLLPLWWLLLLLVVRSTDAHISRKTCIDTLIANECAVETKCVHALDCSVHV
jgi:hypothetical protein